jgi:xanthine dehydrogenase accessory factor
MNDQIAAELIAAARGGPPVAVATVIAAPGGAGVAPGAKLLVRADGTRLGSLGGGLLEGAVAADAHAAITVRPRLRVDTLYYDANGERLPRAETGGYAVMIEVTERPATLLIVGAGHVGQALATAATPAGFSVAIVDDRAAFANEERFPTADHILCGDIVGELQRFPIDDATYVVLVSRGHKQDESGLKAVVTSDAAYVGMIGSQRRVGTVLTHLAREGVPREALERVHTPIGLDIGAETPEEIAVSILAEIILVRRGGTARKMSELRKVRIKD